MIENGTILKDVALKDILVKEQFGLNAAQFRPVLKNRVNDLAANWDTKAAGVLLLSERPEGYYAAIDGQHRTLAALKALGKDATLPAAVFVGLSEEEEAFYFVKYNKERTQPTPYQVFAARLKAGDMRAKAIFAVLSGLGLELVPSRIHDGVRAVTAVESVYDLDGGPLLRRTLSILRDAFAGEAGEPYSHPAIGGLARFLLAYPEAKRPSIVKTLKRAGPDGMTAEMYRVKQVMRGSSVVAWGRALREQYNWKRSSNRLAEWPELIQSPGGKQKRRKG